MSKRGLRMAEADDVVTLLGDTCAGDTVDVMDKKTGACVGQIVATGSVRTFCRAFCTGAPYLPTMQA